MKFDRRFSNKEICKLAAIYGKMMNESVRSYLGQPPTDSTPGDGLSTRALYNQGFDPCMAWLIWKGKAEKDGWKYGKNYNKEKKTHPNLVSIWEDLPKEEQIKDYVYATVCFVVHDIIRKIGLRDEDLDD